MKLNYFPDTDSLYIDLSHRPSVESQEVSESVVLDYDGDGQPGRNRHRSRQPQTGFARTGHKPHPTESESLAFLSALNFSLATAKTRPRVTLYVPFSLNKQLRKGAWLQRSFYALNPQLLQ